MTTTASEAWPARRHRGDLAVGVAGALVVFAGVPAVLTGLVGVPLPRHWTASEILSARSLFDALALVSWGAWAACAWGILRSVLVRVATGDLSPGRHVLDALGLRIAIGTLCVWALFGALSASAGAAGASQPVAARTLGSEPAPLHPGVGRAQPEKCGHLLTDPNDGRAATSLSTAVLDVRLSRTPDGSRASAEPAGGGHLPALPLAELGGAAFSALVAALFARRARQLRRLEAFVRAEGERAPSETEARIELDLAVARSADPSALDWVELAARLPFVPDVTGDDPARGRDPDRDPEVRAIRAGTDGIEVFWGQDAGAWRGASEGSTWWVRGGDRSSLLPATLDPDALRRVARDAPPWCPILLPVGRDQRGSWLLSLPVGRCASVIGPRAGDLTRALQAAASRWSWSEQVVVTDDPGEARAATSTRRGEDARSVPRPGPSLLFVGDPSDLSSDVRMYCALLATVPVEDADVTIVVDEKVASIHPLGLSIRPNLLGARWDAALLDGTPAAQEDPCASRGPERDATPPEGSRSTPALSSPRRAVAAIRIARPHGAQHLPLERGRAEIRLLGTLPEILGLSAELPAKRARRAVEVLAYLALHHPDPVTSDRLRTRVLGSTDTDAASKTLFNIVGAARSALGADDEGNALLRRATRAGLYTISTLVTVDAARACGLLEAGMSATSRDDTNRLLQEGLALIRAEPLGGVLTGYEWWSAEGHLRRLADVCVDGACALARGALVSGDIDLARWSVDQARTVERYSETLSRMAMRVAAAAGDVPRLHLEWKDCRRQVDELDPGSLPSETTEHLYARLRLQIGAGPATQGTAGALGA